MTSSFWSLAFSYSLTVWLVACHEPSEMIVGGQSARPGQFPFVVGLRQNEKHYFCAGAVINSRWIITVARCLHGEHRDWRAIRAYVGAHTQTDGIEHRLDRVVVHPRFNNPYYFNDVALLRTANAIRFEAGRVHTVRLPRTNVDDEARERVWVAGWGVTQFPPTSENFRNRFAAVLQFKQTTVIPNDVCVKIMRRRRCFVHKTNVCTNSADRRGICFGDYGAPLVNGDGVLVGVASWSFGCGRSLPDVYTSIFDQMPFIMQAMRS